MKIKIYILLIISFIFLAFKNIYAKNTIIIYPKIIRDKVLFNPGMGLYFPTWCNRPESNAWYSKIANIAYTRFTWAQLEPKEGVYKFDEVLGKWIKIWKNLGYRVAFGVMSTTVERTATPLWVFKYVPGVVHRNGTQIDPVYWDRKYLEKYSKFVKALGKYLNNGVGIEFIDMRGIGVWGEMHLGLHIPGMWTKEELKKYGFTYSKYFDAYKKMINFYLEAFPNTYLFLNISRYDKIAEYAAKNGVGLRFDGLGLRMTKKVPKIFKKFGYNGVKLPVGVKCNYEFARKEKDPRVIKKIVKQALRVPISYLHINLGPLDKLSDETKSILHYSALKIGYRFILRGVKITKNITDQSIVFIIDQEWINEGVAPCYKNFYLALAFVDLKGNVLFEKKIVPDPPTFYWNPLSSINIKSFLTIPKSILDGEYKLKLYMFDPNSPGVRIKLGINGNDGKNMYKIAKIVVFSKQNKKYIKIFNI